MALCKKLGLITIDFANEDQVEEVIQETIIQSAQFPDLQLKMLSQEEAMEHLGKTLSANMFRKNISRSAERSSFLLANGLPYPGHCRKPVFQVKGNKILQSSGN